MSRSSVKGKEIHNRFDGSQRGRFGGHTVHRRLSVGLPKDLDDFLTEQSSALKTGKAEIIRRLLTREITMDRVTCPKCHGNGYVRDEGNTAIDCSYCDSQGEVPKQSADEWPCK